MCRYCPTPDLEPYLPFARKGAAFLDAHGPEDWHDSIAVKKLDQGNGEECVLGQVYGTYNNGTLKLGICETFAEANGFTTPMGGVFDEHDEEENDRGLTAAWLQVLTERRTVTAAA